MLTPTAQKARNLMVERTTRPGAPPTGPSILFVVGDHSGDIAAAETIRVLRKLRPDARIAGLGGPAMAEAGCDIIYPLVELAIMWFRQVYDNIHRIIHIQRLGLDYVDRVGVDVVVPVDYPGFNLFFARWLMSRRIPVAYYISPQIWAWFPWRIRKIRRRVTKMLVILPFEEQLYRDAGVPVSYVGHPLGDFFANVRLGPPLKERLGIGRGEQLIGLFPGSRDAEVERMLPVMLRAAQELARRRSDCRFAVACRNEVHRKVIGAKLAGFDVEVQVTNDVLELMRDADFAYVTSGTATLQLAHFLTPMVVLYRVGTLSWFLGKALMRCPYIALVNLMAGREVVPEFLLRRDRPTLLADAAEHLLEDGAPRKSVLAGLREIKDIIDEPGAAEYAAREILELAERGRPPRARREAFTALLQGVLAPAARTLSPKAFAPLEPKS